ncbi:23S rRNA (uracil(1939)-C(5))-methyltransferase RlmD [Muriicola sp. Z0-33]|uniref:23S rRNA (uracil(1939)-C(5))-methyltransferase RlmD n=1 Tax=Muriicola sp. Z0-33 TaxID=2816957 RepID=UPI002237D51E|nr:23S rRNA (uracil(1939)-C(5))-methyltransferase RlmD [Muriicola sp. Z0-33]MCW5516503.1 23S rRNA (uracil(1939)-C(5))-methyltransferase RlmD [Muriicola sp. Z0-33]
MRKKREPKVFEQIEVLDAGAKGKTIAKAPDGRVIFLSNAVPGDVVDIRTTKKRRAYFEGVAIKFHKLSDKRVSPVCQHFGVCGGCKWQHMGYEHQLHYKQKEVTNNLQRIGHLELPEVTPILGCNDHYLYRNKMEFSFSDSRWLTEEEINSEEQITDKNALGFHIPGMWDKILNIEKCHLQKEPSNAIRLATRSYAIEKGITFFNPRKQKGTLRTLMIRTSSTNEVMVLLQFFEDNEIQRNLLLEYLKQTFPEISSLLYVINTKQNDTIYDQEIRCYSGNDHIYEEMEGLRFKITAKSFYQTNSEQAYELYKIVRKYAALTGKELVYDLYTGTGTIAQFVSKSARKVIGIESVADAVSAARENAILNGIKNAEFYVGDMKNIFTPDFISKNGSPDIIITDPPRDGMHKDVVQQILNIAPSKVVYVSCNSATQARDLELMKNKYVIEKTQAVDMFPQTHHVENVVLLKLRSH